MVTTMNELQTETLDSESTPTEDDTNMSLLDQAREIEKDMFRVMNTQVRLAMMQVALAALGIAIALILAALH